MQGRAPAHIMIPWPMPTRKSLRKPTGSHPAASTMNRITSPPYRHEGDGKEKQQGHLSHGQGSLTHRHRHQVLQGVVVLFLKEQVGGQYHQGRHEQQIGAHLKQGGHHAVHRLGAAGELPEVRQEQGAPQGDQCRHGSGSKEQGLAPQLGKFTPQEFKQ